ncbi:hypothetical protein HMJ29_14260 [Hymenobacter taeanensis]|uniref:Uncharacterized protein n=1 Tax=Hymenobacter taeanensis TaxID=2735321 RepID=A0A6M6BJI7_9BACT|nr:MULTISPECIES: hypothetical protein [Hymenobacter]QJX48038.1 hypothetical protein HMJ29_14260 [Hymenobacter taeanensis]UOQ82514.1 hypothetical protein MUN83_07045 [Hymenobacter sp. 5414T-23]
MQSVLPWLPLLLLPFLAGLFTLISFLVSRLGWSRLARQYAVAAVPGAVERKLLAYVRIGFANYKNSVKAGATPQGLWLTTWKIFFLGHPPLCIPWSAFGPVQAHKFLWTTRYITTVNSGSDTVRFIFTNPWLRQMLPPSIPVQE